MYDLLDDNTPILIDPSIHQLLTESQIFVQSLASCFDEITSTIALDSAEDKYIPLSLLAHLVMTSSSVDLKIDQIHDIISDAVIL